jgi:GT2 family glycosyltransferase
MKWYDADLYRKQMNNNKVDTLGLKVLRNRRVVDKYSQKKWDDIKGKVNLSYHTKNGMMEVFGLSGALAMYRRDALRLIELAPGKIFDEDYISYKEDVDLAYRLRIAGYNSYILLDSVAYHSRSVGIPEKLRDSVAIANKCEQSLLVKYHSYKNHLATLYTNEYWQNFVLDLPWILWYEIKKFIYFLFFDRQVLKGTRELWKNRAYLKIKRKNIIKIRKISWRQMRKWWN